MLARFWALSVGIIGTTMDVPSKQSDPQPGLFRQWDGYSRQTSRNWEASAVHGPGSTTKIFRRKISGCVWLAPRSRGMLGQLAQPSRRPPTPSATQSTSCICQIFLCRVAVLSPMSELLLHRNKQIGRGVFAACLLLFLGERVAARMLFPANTATTAGRYY